MRASNITSRPPTPSEEELLFPEASEADEELKFPLSRAERIRKRCYALLLANERRVREYQKRIETERLPRSKMAIMLANTEDKNGKQIAEALLPVAKWGTQKESGVFLYMGGTVSKTMLADLVQPLKRRVAQELRERSVLVAVVIDNGSIEIFDV